MLIIILISLLAIGIFLVIVALRPSDFRVTRSASIPAPATVVFEQFNDLHKWNEWSPWAKMDPNSKITYEGQLAGVGAGFSWAGSKAGEGLMTITESRPSERIVARLQFFKPFTATNEVEFTFTPEGDETAVTWSMSGKNNFMAKLIGLVMNCEKMCGDQFEQGFANLKSMLACPVAT